MTILPLLLAAAVADAPHTCRSCHEAQGAGWEQSLHAAASSDPLVKAMREWAQRDAGEAVAAKCADCHSVPLLDGTARSAMVTCEACHQGRRLGPGPAGWVIDPAHPVRAARAAESAPHAVAVDEALTNGELCLVCHAELHNAAGVALCTTGPEHAARRGAASCVDCHADAADHRFEGATPRPLARAAALSVDFIGGEAVVAVTNSGAGHSLPTGSALRRIVLEVAFLDDTGTVLRRNADDGRARFEKVLRDADGNAPAPPWRAVAQARDTRLVSGETRHLAYAVPAGAARIEARLVFHRAPAALAARLGLADAPLLAPVVMARFTREVPPAP